jgi:hypothetical protein
VEAAVAPTSAQGRPRRRLLPIQVAEATAADGCDRRLLLYVVSVGVGGNPLQPRRRGAHWLPIRFCGRD